MLHSGEEMFEGEAIEKATAARQNMLSKVADISKVDMDAVMRIMAGGRGDGDEDEEDEMYEAD
eukprot:12256017-Prorocentrum_lima.AAC.1